MAYAHATVPQGEADYPPKSPGKRIVAIIKSVRIVMPFFVPPISDYPKPATRHSDHFHFQAEDTKEDEQAFLQQVQAFEQSLTHIRATD